ncbi:MAG TPA: T9SS type A sorting domain-containing protein [Bacteroidia bacterium]|jgi:hypothetical protein|nr:T9SS type A sorting domain-containing protein [Bacteroidia bacterium]
MKIYHPGVLNIVFLLSISSPDISHCQAPKSQYHYTTDGYLAQWSRKPFDNMLFIQNLGQFDSYAPDKILYAVTGGDTTIFFTPNGIIGIYWEYSEQYSKFSENEKEEPGKDSFEKPIMHHFELEWENSTRNVIIEDSGKQDYPHIYPKNIAANLYKKIIYRNLYPGIDVEYSFNEVTKSIECKARVQPEADITQLKLRYTPDSGKSRYEKANNIYDKTQTHRATSINWSISPGFTGGEEAYNVGYDINGNVYACGGDGNPDGFQIVKFNSTGTVQWVNSSAIFNGFGSTPGYGSFTVDYNTGNSYIALGTYPLNSELQEFNNAGTQINTATSATENEFWRIIYNECNAANPLLIGGGGTGGADQMATANASCGGLTLANPLGTALSTRDVCLMALDPSGTSCYVAFSQAAVTPGSFNNVMYKLSFPAFGVQWGPISDGYSFAEITSVTIVPVVSIKANAINGMAATPSAIGHLYTYDGATLKQWNSNTGASTGLSVATGGTAFANGGLDVDACDNIYAGEGTSIKIYNSSLTNTSIISGLAGTVYDVKLGANSNTTLYACGNGFVTSIAIASTGCATHTCLNSLPIELQKFDCEISGNSINLNWTTETENNNKYFTVERMNNQGQFMPIANVPGAGNSAYPKNYSYLDNTVTSGTYYYRLSQTDYDGNTETFYTTACTINDNIPGNIFPDPSPGKFSVSLDNSVTEIIIYNILGQAIYNKTVESPGADKLHIDISAEPNGIYLLNLITNTKTETKKVLINH